MKNRRFTSLLQLRPYLLRWRPTALLAMAVLMLVVRPDARAQDTASLATFHLFADGNGGFYQPNTVIQGSDGNFYGTTSVGPRYGSVFRLTPAGELTSLYVFGGGVDGGVPNPGLIQGSDGNFYGTTVQNATNDLGTVFQVTPTGGFKVLHSFGSNEGGTLAGVIQGSDGNLYGTIPSGRIYRVSAAGDFAIVADGLHQINGGLVQGSDGNLYGIDSGQAFYGPRGRFFRVTLTGVVTILYTFAADNDEVAASALIQGSDGNFYGTTSDSGYGAEPGTIFRVSPSGAYTLLHRFDSNSQNTFAANSQLVQGRDGNFYGTTLEGGAYNMGSVFRITPDGTFTSLYSFDGNDGQSPGISVGYNSSQGAALVQTSDGSFYGTANLPGDVTTGKIFRLTIQPDFFTGAAALSNDVYYLTFPNGTPFGYYSYLADPRYVFHFDLGYEYVFNAADGQDGVYLYDFKSNGFFYTSPTFPFPYLYDFSLGSVVYYYPDPSNPGRYNTNGIRYFYVFQTGQAISK